MWIFTDILTLATRCWPVFTSTHLYNVLPSAGPRRRNRSPRIVGPWWAVLTGSQLGNTTGETVVSSLFLGCWTSWWFLTRNFPLLVCVTWRCKGCCLLTATLMLRELVPHRNTNTQRTLIFSQPFFFFLGSYNIELTNTAITGVFQIHV